jgi:Tol biopolymer transport system component
MKGKTMCSFHFNPSSARRAFRRAITWIVLLAILPLSLASPSGPAFGKVVDAPAGSVTYLGLSDAEGAISADGRWIAYIASQMYYYHTYVVDRGLTKPPVLISVPPKNDCSSNKTKDLAISADGRHVAFVANGRLVPGFGNCARYSAWVVDRDVDGNGVFDEPGTTHMAMVSNPNLCGVDADVYRVGISGNGRIVTYSCDSYDGLYYTDRDTSNSGVFDQPGNMAFYPQQPGSIWSISSVDATGNFIAYRAGPAANAGCVNGVCPNIYVLNRETGATSLVSASAVGAAGNDQSIYPTISGNGLRVAFSSYAANLTADDLNMYTADVFVKDRMSGAITRVSKGINNTGDAANLFQKPAISEDGRYVAFTSNSKNLVIPPKQNDTTDVFLYDTQTQVTMRLSADSNIDSYGGPSISADGRYVLFVGNGLYLYDQGRPDAPETDFAIYDPSKSYEFSSYTFNVRIQTQPDMDPDGCLRIIVRPPAGLAACLASADGYFGGSECMELVRDVPREWTACAAGNAASGQGPQAAPQASGDPLKPFKLSLTYSPERTSQAGSGLGLFYWDGSTWVKEPTSQVDTAKHILSASPQHWGVWTVKDSGISGHHAYLPVTIR